MAKQIEFEYEDKKYCLEFNRDAIKLMERQGFDIDSFTNKPMTMLELAFEGAFLKNHRGVNASKVKEIYENIGQKRELANELLAMIGETYNSLFGDDNEDDSKNISWKTV